MTEKSEKAPKTVKFTNKTKSNVFVTNINFNPGIEANAYNTRTIKVRPGEVVDEVLESEAKYFTQANLDKVRADAQKAIDKVAKKENERR